MSIGIYQSASTLSALERWQDVVSQNITSSQINGYRKRTVSMSTHNVGEIQPDSKAQIGKDAGVAMSFSKIDTAIDFTSGETLPTRREFDVAIQGDGFFEVKMDDDSRVYTRNGEFRMRPDRTLVTSSGNEVLTEGGSPILLLPGNSSLSINRDGTVFQGDVRLGKLSIQKFADTSALTEITTGYFTADPDAEPETVEEPELLQGYLEGSNVSSLREMVDMVLISRAYEANQKIITNYDDQLEKTLQALG